ncbi:unnamed protein product [Prorocentrum cordatum]|uniref:CCHC-type domain-containing protein n=1 Tax=Prorocentrum cordatum TaxID=2364126 RepID=A0ABN9R5Q0_9DINO|nr:unnamed protein product [Polarella glacialis]
MASGTSSGGAAASAAGGLRLDVPTWDGEPDKLLSYRFDVGLFTKSHKLQDRYVVGPQLVRSLGARARRLAQACPDIERIDDVSDSGKLDGWQRVFEFLLSKLDLSNVSEMGNSAEKLFNKLQQEVGGGFPDWTARWEAHERDLLAQLKAVDGAVTEVIAGPLRTWWYLRRSRLSLVARGEITAVAGGDYDFDQTYKALCARHPLDALKELDGAREKKDRRAGFYGEADDNDVDHNDGDRSELADIVDQLVTLADEDDAMMLDDLGDTEEGENGIYAEFKQMGRNFKDMRDLIRRLKVARDYYPVLAPRPPDGPPRPRAARDQPRKPRADGEKEPVRDMRRMRCLACRKFGHQAKDCPERNKTRGRPQPNETTSFALLELGELVLLLDDDGGIWAILDCGATRSLIGVTMAENLAYDMKERHDINFDLAELTRYFTFGDGRRKSSMGAVTGDIFLGDGLENIEISIMDNEVSLLIGMDILGPACASALIDCGNGYIMLPKTSSNIFQCRKMSSGRLAINVTTPTWWQHVPRGIPNITEPHSEKALVDVSDLPEAKVGAELTGSAELLSGAAEPGLQYAGTKLGGLQILREDPPSNLSSFGSLYCAYDVPGDDFYDAETEATFADILGDIFGYPESLYETCEGDSDQEGARAALKHEDLDVLQQAIDQYDLGYKQEIGDDINFLVRQGRCDLMEVCAPPTSALTQAVIDQGGLAFRAGVHNGFNVATKTRVQKARRIQAGCETLLSIGLQYHGAGVDLEQPQSSQSWSRSASLQRIKEQACETLVSGCAYGLRCPRSGLLLPKVWKICSTDPELQKAIGKRCSNRPGRHDNHEHGEIICGKVVASTAFYPAALCKAWAKRILRAGGGSAAGSQALLTCDSVEDEPIYVDIAEDDDVEPDDQAESDEQIYADIAGDDDVEPEHQAGPDDELDGQELAKDGGRLSTKEEQEIEHRLGRLHRNLGHPSAWAMVKILKNSGASLQVLKMAKNFMCHACNSSVLPKAVRTAAGIEIPEDDAIYLLTLNLDEGSGLALVTNHGDKSQRSGNWSAADVVETWRSWADHYRAPRLIRCDAEGCHRAELTKGWCSSRGIEMFIAPGEAHWLMGMVERRIQIFKRTLTKFWKQNYDCDVDEAISQVIHAIDDLDKVGGHYTYANAFGIGGAQGSNNPFAIIDDGSGESREQRRLTARQSFIEVEYSERRRHAEQACSRVTTHWHTGEHCYYWRRAADPSWPRGTAQLESWYKSNGFWRQLRPATGAERMVVELANMEKRGASMSDLMEVALRGTFEDLTNESRPTIQHFEPQTVMPPETQADTTADEPMEDEAPGLEADAPGSPEPAGEPTTPPTPSSISTIEQSALKLPRLSPPEESTPTPEEGPPGRRWRMYSEESEGTYRQSPAERRANRPGPYSDTRGQDSVDQANSEDDLFVDVNTLSESGLAGLADFEFLDENMTVYFEMLKSELTDSQGGRRLTSQMVDCFVANPKRKDKIEFHWGKLSPSEKVEFRAAMTKEVTKWNQYKGLRPVPASEVKDPAGVIKCRWVLPRKADGAAKARLVLLGYQTKDIGKEPTASPTASRRARNILLTIAAANHWNVVEGDVTSAFLQAYDLEKDLFVEADEALPPPSAFNLVKYFG